MPHSPCDPQRVWRRSWIFSLLLTWFFALPLCICAEEPKAPATAEQLQTWGEQLDSDEFNLREEAMVALIAEGKPSVEITLQFLRSPSLEASSRALHVLESLAQSDDLETQTLARDAIEQLAKEEGPMAKRLAAALAELNKKRASKALLELEKLGIKVERLADWQGFPQFPQIGIVQNRPPSGNFLAIEIDAQFKGTLADLKRLQWLTNVYQIALTGEGITNETLAMAAKVPNLDSLHLYDCPLVTDDGMMSLLDAKQLREVGIYYMPLSDAATKPLQQLTSLSLIKLYGTKVTDAAKNQLQSALLAARIDLRKGAFLGVGCQNSDNELNVTLVHEGSPAELAGLRPGDVLLTFEGKPLAEFENLTELIAEHLPGEKLSLDVRRRVNENGQYEEKDLVVEVELGRWDLKLSVRNNR